MTGETFKTDLSGQDRTNEVGATAAAVATPAPSPAPDPTPAPVTTPSVVVGIKLTATAQGYYVLYKNGVKVSQHTSEREAIESGSDIKLSDQQSIVEYKHDYTVSIELETK